MGHSPFNSEPAPSDHFGFTPMASTTTFGSSVSRPTNSLGSSTPTSVVFASVPIPQFNLPPTTSWMSVPIPHFDFPPTSSFGYSVSRPTSTPTHGLFGSSEAIHQYNFPPTTSSFGSSVSGPTSFFGSSALSRPSVTTPQFSFPLAPCLVESPSGVQRSLPSFMSTTSFATSSTFRSSVSGPTNSIGSSVPTPYLFGSSSTTPHPHNIPYLFNPPTTTSFGAPTLSESRASIPANFIGSSPPAPVLCGCSTPSSAIFGTSSPFGSQAARSAIGSSVPTLFGSTSTTTSAASNDETFLLGSNPTMFGSDTSGFGSRVNESLGTSVPSRFSAWASKKLAEIDAPTPTLFGSSSTGTTLPLESNPTPVGLGHDLNSPRSNAPILNLVGSSSMTTSTNNGPTELISTPGSAPLSTPATADAASKPSHGSGRATTCYAVLCSLFTFIYNYLSLLFLISFPPPSTERSASSSEPASISPSSSSLESPSSQSGDALHCSGVCPEEQATNDIVDETSERLFCATDEVCDGNSPNRPSPESSSLSSSSSSSESDSESSDALHSTVPQRDAEEETRTNDVVDEALERLPSSAKITSLESSSTSIYSKKLMACLEGTLSVNFQTIMQIRCKHGDISKGSLLKGVEANAKVFELIAEVVEDLDNDMLDTNDANAMQKIENVIVDASTIGFRVDWLKQRVKRVVARSKHDDDLARLKDILADIREAKLALMEMEVEEANLKRKMKLMEYDS